MTDEFQSQRLRYMQIVTSAFVVVHIVDVAVVSFYHVVAMVEFLDSKVDVFLLISSDDEDDAHFQKQY